MAFHGNGWSHENFDWDEMVKRNERLRKEHKEKEDKITRSLSGSHWCSFNDRAIDNSKTLLGNRYLNIGGSLFIVAPSGHGKSVLVAQASIEFACGLDSFGIHPARPLRSIIFQAEDDEGDCIEMAQIISHLELSRIQREMVAANTWVEFVNDLTGTEFLRFIDSVLEKEHFDLIWINPYTAYLGGEIKDDALNTTFLRIGLNPILTKHQCAVIPVHHTPKTNFRHTNDWKPSDWMYAGAGASVLSNWARAYLVIDPCEIPGVYRFIAAKRGKRIGWGVSKPVYERFFAHSDNEDLFWLPATDDQIAMNRKSADKTPDDLLPMIPVLDPIPKEELRLLANQRGFAYNKIDDFLKILMHQQKIFRHKIYPPGLTWGFGYSKTPP